MMASVGLTLSGLIFTVLIAIIYFSKKKYHEVEHKLYSFLLLWTIFLLLLEFYCVFTMRHRIIHPIINEIACRLYVFGAITWIISVIIYVIILNKKEKLKRFWDIFKEPIVLFFISSGLIMFIISCFRPLTYISGKNKELYVIGGPAVSVLYLVFAVVGLYLFYLLLKKDNKASWNKRSPVIFFIVAYFLMFIFQYYYTDINDLTFVFGLVVVAMYFTIVSQDYKLVTDLGIAKEEAEKANNEKTEFLSKMSHEIRTPINAIMGFSKSILNDDNLTKDRMLDDVKNIYIAGNNLVSTINNILDISKIESGKVILNEKKYFIGDIIYELNDYINLRLDQTKVKFVLDIEEDIPMGLLGDKQKISKALLNILNNSVRYTKGGEISLKVMSVVSKGYANLTFIISDTGIGIKEEDFDKVFVKFAKLATDMSNIERGAGLGLSISKALVDMMGGSISFTSEYNVGTTFKVELKNKVLDYHKCGDIMARKEVLKAIEPKLDCSNKKIAIVDDNKLNLKVTYNLLKNYNANVALIESGEALINLINKNEHFDLIIIDEFMPLLNGIDTIRKLKDIKDYKIPPIIVTTANITNKLKDTLIKEGIDGYIAKPLDAKKIGELLEYYFKK